MKKVLLFMGLVFALSLTACKSTPMQDESSSSTEASKSTENIEAAKTELIFLLNDLNEHIYVGVAGSTMNTAKYAIKLLTWGIQTPLSANDITSAAKEWLSKFTGDSRVSVLEKMNSLDSSYNMLLGENIADFLSAAGLDDVKRFWGTDPVASIESLMKAFGLR